MPVPTPAPTVMRGSVHGGLLPVTGATIQLYAVGTTGDGSPATPLLSTATVTDASGYFDLTGLYTCPAGNPLIYVVATGGNPGVSANNPNLSLMATLGSCSSLTASTSIVINELTTVAAVYALAPFISSPTAIGSAPNHSAAMAAEFNLSAEFVDTTLGTSPGTAVPAGTTVPIAQINTIADILATCIESTGGTSGDGSPCGTLFALTTPPTTPATSPATNTIAALLNLANNPTLNTSALFALVTPSTPFQPVQTIPPPDLGVQANSPSALYATPSSLSFGTWVPGTTTPAQTIGVTNFTSTTATLSPVISGPAATSFAISGGTCGATLTPQAYCTYLVTFTPAAATALNASLILSSSSSTSPLQVLLSGTGVAANAGRVSLSPSSLSFDISGTTQDILVQNFGATPLTISNIVLSNFGSNNSTYLGNSAYFTQTNNCGSSLAAQSVCTVSVASHVLNYSNAYPVQFTATLTILDNAAAGPQTASLTSANTSQVSPSNPSISSSAVGVPATAQLSMSSGHYNIPPSLSYTIGGANPADFSINSANSYGCTVLAGYQCLATVTFTPAAAGVRTARLVMNGSSQYIPLTGTTPTSTTTPGFVVSPSPFSLQLALPSADPNGQSGVGSLTISNHSSTTFSYVGTLSGPNASVFTADGSSCTALAPQQSCNVILSMTGVSAAGVYSANLLIKDANSALSQLVPITGTGIYWQATSNPGNLIFGAQAVGTTSASKTFVLADGNGYPLGHPLSVALPSPSNFVFTQGATCPASLTQPCTLAIAFSPYQSGSISEVARFTDQTTGYSSVLYLSGTAGAAAVSLSPNTLSFPTRSIATTSIPITVTLTNSGTLPLTVSSVSIVGAVNNNFTQTNNCATLDVNNTCAINVTFAPTTGGTQSASIQIVSNASSSPDRVAISGIAQ
ncbi:MAG TPA: choice-of-anchor D domain-containing protein [Acidobacteriaceae bacterium]|nr:choice-of-anchor D domain-containing protein [Acidobacteriaceae bacterium]